MRACVVIRVLRNKHNSLEARWDQDRYPWICICGYICYHGMMYHMQRSPPSDLRASRMGKYITCVIRRVHDLGNPDIRTYIDYNTET